MSKEKEIQEIERIKSSLEFHFEKYKVNKHNLKHASRKKDRDRASDDMITNTKYIERELSNPLVADEIYDGNQYQFEDFFKYVDSDLPDYLRKIESKLERLKSENKEE